MKAVFLTMMLAGLGLLYACGGSNTPEPEPEEPYFKLTTEGETWEMEVKEAYYDTSFDLVSQRYIHRFKSGYSKGGFNRNISLSIYTTVLGTLFEASGEPYSISTFDDLQPQLYLTGRSSNVQQEYITRFCANRDYKIEIVELDEKNKRIRIKFEGKLCSEDGTDSVRVTNGECWATYE